MTTLVDARDVWVKYRGANDYALKGVSVSVSEGEVVAVVGPTGAGKTTLCKVLSGIIPNFGAYDDFKGNVTVDGKSTLGKRVGEISRSCAMVFQDYESQLFRTTVELEVAFGPENLCLSRDEILKRVRRSLELVGLVGFEKRYSFALSGGQKQRLAIASMLALQPKVLILDEATSDLDPRGKREVYAVVRRLLDEGAIRSLVMVDHHLDKVAEFADRVVLMDSGRVVMEGGTEDVLSEVDLLRSLGLNPPEPAELFHDLGLRSKPLPMTVEEALERMPALRNFRKPSEEEVNSREPAVEVEDLWFAYPGGDWVLKGVNLTVRSGEMVGLIGQNGSGKTTLAQTIMGILKPGRGRVRLFGKDVTSQDLMERAVTVGYVFQNPDYQIFTKSVYEEIAYGLRARGMGEEEVRKRVEEIARMVGLSALLDEDPFFLPKAHRQRVAVASVLALNPKVVILDEPSTGLSPGETRALMDLARELNRRGTTFIIITHEMWVVAEYCNRVVLMSDGNVVLDAPTRKAFSMGDFIRKYEIEPPAVTEISRRLLGTTYLTVREFVESVEVS
ncbi:MAG: energy-coupling factor transporter ATPase [Candidatus Calditenuis sp.]|nr:energy-coupling factor transporter ATPase [Candidatus Calditenuis sp.]